MFVDKKNSPSPPITRFLSVFSSQNFRQCLLDMVFLPNSPSMYSIRLVFPTQGFYQCPPFNISNGIPLTGFSALSLPHRDSSDFQQCLPYRVFCSVPFSPGSSSLTSWFPPVAPFRSFHQYPPPLLPGYSQHSPGVNQHCPHRVSTIIL
jgi:hypothetical protein